MERTLSQFISATAAILVTAAVVMWALTISGVVSGDVRQHIYDMYDLTTGDPGVILSLYHEKRTPGGELAEMLAWLLDRELSLLLYTSNSVAYHFGNIEFEVRVGNTRVPLTVDMTNRTVTNPPLFTTLHQDSEVIVVGGFPALSGSGVYVINSTGAWLGGQQVAAVGHVPMQLATTQIMRLSQVTRYDALYMTYIIEDEHGAVLGLIARVLE
jgi:hypothetical protein